jgi:hypothetical protein
MFELVLFFSAVLFGKLFGYKETMTASFWLGVIVAGCFSLIVAGNLIVIVFTKVFRNRKNPFDS